MSSYALGRRILGWVFVRPGTFSKPTLVPRGFLPDGSPIFSVVRTYDPGHASFLLRSEQKYVSFKPAQARSLASAESFPAQGPLPVDPADRAALSRRYDAAFDQRLIRPLRQDDELFRQGIVPRSTVGEADTLMLSPGTSPFIKPAALSGISKDNLIEDLRSGDASAIPIDAEDYDLQKVAVGMEQVGKDGLNYGLRPIGGYEADHCVSTLVRILNGARRPGTPLLKAGPNMTPEELGQQLRGIAAARRPRLISAPKPLEASPASESAVSAEAADATSAGGTANAARAGSAAGAGDEAYAFLTELADLAGLLVL